MAAVYNGITKPYIASATTTVNGLAEESPFGSTKTGRWHQASPTLSQGLSSVARRFSAPRNAVRPVEEDPWLLCRPPPAFPVDNSSAKAVPKISYASKVKENLAEAESGSRATSPDEEVLVGERGEEKEGEQEEEDKAAEVVGISVPMAGADNPGPRRDGGELPEEPDAPAPTPALKDIFQNQWGLSFFNDSVDGSQCEASSRTRPAISGVTCQVQESDGDREYEAQEPVMRTLEHAGDLGTFDIHAAMLFHSKDLQNHPKKTSSLPPLYI
uniref:Uncharacterized protein n=1 Tax=Eptatretus burgeri TaxID=7764 RepID=A0A8C4NCF1_EPTBU